MASVYYETKTRKVRVTLEFEVMPDFEARQIDWEKKCDLQSGESVTAYVEDFDDDISWW